LLNLLPGDIGLQSDAVTIKADGPRAEPWITLVSILVRQDRFFFNLVHFIMWLIKLLFKHYAFCR